ISFWFGCKIRVENSLQILLGNADAFVSDRDLNKFAGWQIRSGWVLLRVLAEIFSGDVKCSASRHGLLCVNDQIGDDLTDLTGINFRRPKIIFHVALAT